MFTDEAQERLTALFAEEGIDLAQLTPDTTQRLLDAFKKFAAEPVESRKPDEELGGLLRLDEESGDAFLFETGVQPINFSSGPPVYFVSLVRQFIFNDEEGEYVEKEQLHCYLFYSADALASAPHETLWSFELSLDDFFSQVESMASFRALVEQGIAPLAARVEQSVV